MATTTSLRDLPDFPALQQIQEALWGLKEVRGAAVMVGAGFSTFAELPAASSTTPPLWRDFQRAMAERLYPTGAAPTNPLRLAEEYEASLGRHALNALIRNLVRDDQWQPGVLHSRLLNLPWADVLTTNWDTLLERTSIANIDITHDTVRIPEDIARTRAPRIVKLHGSLPSHTPFIFTEEDFRTYPRLFAPFVNLAQQVLLENELCLLGFSGDDPNFLAWSGWVRDHLGRSARRIRLIGALNLSISQRQVLEHYNVSPIDLWPLVKNLPSSFQHRRATEIFLDSLSEAKPKPFHVWKQRERTPPDPTLKIVDPNDWTAQLAAEWRAEREHYPGWLVPPPSSRYEIRYDARINEPEFRTNLPKANAENHARFVHEIVWRYDTALLPLGSWLEGRVEETLANATGVLTDDERSDLYLSLIREARHRRDWERYDNLITQVDVIIIRGRRVELAYEHALRLRDEMNIEELASRIGDISGDDPAWGIRRAALLGDINEPERAAETLVTTLEDIRRRRARDKLSIWLLSREAWAEWLMARARFALPRDKRSTTEGSFDRWPPRYKAADCDPWDEVHYLNYELETSAKRRSEDLIGIQPRFDAGTYLDRSTRIKFSGGIPTSLVQEIGRLAEKVGLPRELGTDVIGDQLTRALEIEPDRSAGIVWLAARTLRSAEDGLIEHYFTRLEVSRLSYPIIESLVRQLRKAIEYNRRQLLGDRGEPLHHLVRSIELLSRLCVRLPATEAMELFRWAITLAGDLRSSHWWLFKPLDHLLTRSLEALPLDRLKEVARDIVAFPLPDEENKGEISDWPEPSWALRPAVFAERDESHAWNHPIAELIEAVRTGSSYTRPRAVWRLLRLHEAAVLTEEERRAFAAALWSRRISKDGLPEDTQLYAHVLLALPEPELRLARAVFDRVVVKNLVAGDLSEFALNSLAAAAADESQKYTLSTSDAVSIFDACLRWAPQVATDDCFLSGKLRRENADIENALGRCLADAVLPVLTIEALGPERIKQFCEAMADSFRPTLLPAAAELVRLAPDERAQVISIVRRSLAGGNERAIHGATLAVKAFARSRHQSSGFPMVFATDIVAMCAIRREPGLLNVLWCACQLVKAGALPADETDRIIESLEFLLTETNYENWDSRDPRTRSLSLIRRQCVWLAHDLRTAGHDHPIIMAWLSVPANDPVPEVRFALLTVARDA